MNPKARRRAQLAMAVSLSLAAAGAQGRPAQDPTEPQAEAWQDNYRVMSVMGKFQKLQSASAAAGIGMPLMALLAGETDPLYGAQRRQSEASNLASSGANNSSNQQQQQQKQLTFVVSFLFFLIQFEASSVNLLQKNLDVEKCQK